MYIKSFHLYCFVLLYLFIYYFAIGIPFYTSKTILVQNLPFFINFVLKKIT